MINHLMSKMATTAHKVKESVRRSFPRKSGDSQERGKRVMYSTELVEAVAKRTGYSKRDVKEIYGTILAEIKESLNSGEEVSLTNFGKFYVAEIADRTITCPTGEKKKVKKHNTIRFTAGAGLKAVAPKIRRK